MQSSRGCPAWSGRSSVAARLPPPVFRESTADERGLDEIVDRLMRVAGDPHQFPALGRVDRRFPDDDARQRRRDGPHRVQPPLQGATEIVSGWYMVAICYLPWAWIERRDNHIVAGIFENIGRELFSFLARRRRQDRHLRLLLRVLLADLGPCGAADLGRPARCGARRRLHSGVAEPLGASAVRRPDGRPLLRVVRDIGRGYQPAQHEGELREGGT